MSSIYNLEPPTKGKVVLHTSLGDIDIELWPKEAPRAVRNFVQLCLEGYYDNTIFHRLIKDFMLQGGDPTGTGDGGASIYGHPFKDEFHTRLKFNHRGLVACANRNQPDTNGSQFFLTLDRADHCDRKYTIFGKVTGDTIYNLLRFNELETGDDDRPVEPPRLMRADVLWNPFDDIKPRVDREAKEAAEAEAAKKREVEERKARKASKNFKLISFGEEAEEEEQQGTAAAAKIRSAHDVLEDERLSREAALEVDLAKVREAVRAAKAKKVQEREEAGTSGAAGESKEEEEEGGGPREGGGGGGDDFGARMRARMEARRKEMGDDKGPSGREAKGSGGGGGGSGAAGEEEGGKRGRVREPDSEDASEDSQDRKRSRLAQRPQGQKASAAVVLPSRQIKVADAELLTDWERKRQEYKQRKRLGGERQKSTLEKMARFASSLKGKASTSAAAAAGAAAGGPAAAAAAAEPAGPSSAAASKGGGVGGEEGYRGEVRQDVDHKAYMPAAWRADNYLDGDDEGDDLTSLRQHKLSFAKDARDAMSRSDNVDDYVVVDPLLEKGKAKFNKLMQRQKKRDNEWAGGSIT